MAEDIDDVFRDWNTPGDPSSGEYEPEKPRIRQLLHEIQGGDVSSPVVVVSTMAELADANPSAAGLVFLSQKWREGFFYWSGDNLAAEVSSDPGHGLWVPPSVDTSGASGAWVRQFDGQILVTWFGAHPDNEDNTDIYNGIISACLEGSELVWPRIAGGWAGSFDSTKPFVLHLGENLFHEAPVWATGSYRDLPVFRFSGTRSIVTTLTADARYGQTGLTLASTSGIVASSVIMLEDGKVRDDNAKVNQEILRVRAVSSGTALTVWDMVRSDQTFGTRNVYKIDTIVGAQIHGGEIRIVNPYDPATASTPSLWGHSANIVSIVNGEMCLVADTVISNHYGTSINLEACIDTKISGVRIPRGAWWGTSTGEYGPSAYIGRDIVIEDTDTSFCRNVADFHAVYQGRMSDIRGRNCMNGIGIAHNAFGGKLIFERINLAGQGTATYGMNTNPQGRTDGASALILRDVTIRDVDINTLAIASGSAGFIGVYIQQSWANLLIENLTISTGDGTTPASYRVLGVRLDGYPAGQTVIRNVTQARLASDNSGLNVAVWIEGNTGGTSPTHYLVMIEDCNFYWGQTVVYARGVKHLATKNLTAGFLAGGTIKTVETLNGIANVTNVSIGVHATTS